MVGEIWAEEASSTAGASLTLTTTPSPGGVEAAGHWICLGEGSATDGSLDTGTDSSKLVGGVAFVGEFTSLDLVALAG